MNHVFKPLLVAAFICSIMYSTAEASDHLDAPSLRGNGQQDINDLYAFQPGNASNTALILTVNPFADSTTTFGTDTAYRFEIDNTGDSVSDLTYEATFNAAGANGQQSFTLRRNGVIVSEGFTGSRQDFNLGSDRTGIVQAGLFDDPFFFDLTGFNRALDPNDSRTFTGDDTFAGANVSAIVLEIPSIDLLSETGDTNIGVFATTLQNDILVDRVGRPAINTVLIQGDRKEDFNEVLPADDSESFGGEVAARIAELRGLEAADDASIGLADALLPDILTFNTASDNGFLDAEGDLVLNGRRLEDDVIDIELDLITDGGLDTDQVDGNDVNFVLASNGDSLFPFLGAAQAVAVPEPTGLLAIAVAFGTCLVRRRRKS